MWKVVSVDDELLVRNHLRSLIHWEEYGYTFSGEAADGLEAIRLIDDIRPHLAIVDMNMPGIDGVELIQRLTGSHPSLLIVALSSFDSFDYVRGSLSYGAIDYLLKHKLTAEALITVLHKIHGRLENEVKHEKDRQKELKKWQMASPALSQSYLKELLIELSPCTPEYREHFQDMRYGRDGQHHVLVLAKLLNFELLLSRMQEHDLTLFIRSVIDLCSQIVEEAGCVVYMERGMFVILLSKENERSEHTMLQWVSSKLSRMEKSIELYFNSAPVFVQSSMFRSLDSVAGHYAKLLGRLDELQGRPIASDAELAVSHMSIRQEKELLSAVEACDAEAVSRLIGDMMGALSERGVVSASSRSKDRLTNEVIQLAAKIAQKADLQTDWIFQHITAVQKQKRSQQDEAKALQEIFTRLVANLRETKVDRRYSRYIAQTIHRIQTDYMDGLTLEEMADWLRITTAYLSRLFKEETGSTFTEYLTAYRIERSQQLIRTSACTVKEIYRQVGFNSYSYFIKVFKDYAGETPHTYAEKFGK
ncbi:MAG: two component transcriptional regulator, AraC family [Paenibacillus sp.]|nr:two component transcriptional regulator, AraC family [Paenibacillus sp.]